jgi:hypothetical protein
MIATRIQRFTTNSFTSGFSASTFSSSAAVV